MQMILYLVCLDLKSYCTCFSIFFMGTNSSFFSGVTVIEWEVYTGKKSRGHENGLYMLIKKVFSFLIISLQKNDYLFTLVWLQTLDEKQNEIVSIAAEEIAHRKGDLENNLNLTHELKVNRKLLPIFFCLLTCTWTKQKKKKKNTI